jgi:hypothetical protein
VKKLIVQIDYPESVPPAEMVGNHQNRQSLVFKIPIYIYLVKIPLCSPDGIELKELINKKIVGGPVYHFAIVKKIKSRIKNAPWQIKINGASLFVTLMAVSLSID